MADTTLAAHRSAASNGTGQHPAATVTGEPVLAGPGGPGPNGPAANGTGGPSGGAPAGPRHDPKVVTALRRFAISISVFNILGYTVFGFEQPWLWPLIAIAVGYSTELALEWVGSRVEGRGPRYAGNGFRGLVEFLYPAHITALALNMLTYVNDRVITMIFGVVLAISAKWVLRAPVKGKLRHFMNPSNLGITAILLLFPWASIAPPYHFEEYLDGPADWILPVVIIIGGTMLNAKLTNRMWLILGWLSVFALQAVVRGLLLDTSIPAALGMMTGVAFVLFTNYMVTDPGTSPSKPGSQFAFGAGVAVVYGFLMAAHVAYGIFFATTIVCAIRGGFLWALWFVERHRAAAAAAPPAAVAAVPAQEHGSPAQEHGSRVEAGAGVPA